MKIDQLIYFIETAKLEHIGKASKVLGISTSAISHSIAALEDELGHELFQKKGKNIVLTEQGQALLLLSQDLISQFRNLKESLLNSNQEKNHFRIAASHVLTYKLIAPICAQLNQQYPKTTLELISYRSADVVRSILAREMDFGICFSPQSHPDLEMTEIYKGRLLITVRKSHPILKAPKNKQIELLSQYPAVLPKAFQGIDLCITHPMFEKHGIRPQISTTFDSYDTAMRMIEESNSWSLIPDIITQDQLTKVAPILPASGWDAPFHVSMIKLKQKYTPVFYNELCKKLQELASPRSSKRS